MLGLRPDDPRVRRGLELARSRGVEIGFVEEDLGDVHPNTAKIIAWSRAGVRREITASSVGGGAIVVTEINGYPTNLSGDYAVLITVHQDRPGVVAQVAGILAGEGINIATLHVDRRGPGREAWMTVETDEAITEKVLIAIHQLPLVKLAFTVDKL